MKFEIEIMETVQKLNTYVIEVGSEEEGERIASFMEDDIDEADHPDDIFDAFQKAGAKVIEITEEAEEAEYEMY